MGFRFRKSIKLFPGFKINLTHKGISSASIGKPGASLNIGKKVREPVSVFQVRDYLTLNTSLTLKNPCSTTDIARTHGI